MLNLEQIEKEFNSNFHTASEAFAFFLRHLEERDEALKDAETLRKETYELHCADSIECVELQAKLDKARAALDAIMHELGVPQPDYPAPVANTARIAKQAYEESA